MPVLKAIWITLIDLKDVIVFPMVGDIPLAETLSGGDYDGDRPWICWDPEIVDAFENTPYRRGALPTAEDLGLDKCSKPVCKLTSHDEFLCRCFAFNAMPTNLGLCTREHERLCYHENDISSRAA